MMPYYIIFLDKGYRSNTISMIKMNPQEAYIVAETRQEAENFKKLIEGLRKTLLPNYQYVRISEKKPKYATRYRALEVKLRCINNVLIGIEPCRGVKPIEEVV